MKKQNIDTTKTKIYLVSNIDNNINKVYIGKTKSSRKNWHKMSFGNQINYDYIDEINSLKREDWEPLETYWIEQFRQWGFEIVNKRKKGGSGPEFHSKEAKEKLKKPKSKEHRENMSKAKIGHSMFNDVWRKNMSKSQKGKNVTWGNKISESHKHPQKKVKCPYCEIEGGNEIMKRWHFERCKYKQEL